MCAGPGSDKKPEPIHEDQIREKVGKAIGMSGTTYNKAKSVVKAAEEEPETFGPIAEEMDRTGNVLDGHNRAAICDELGIEYPAEVVEGYTEEEKRELIYNLNLHRRHLTKEQRNVVMRKMRSEGATLQKIADATGTSPATAMRQTETVFSNEKTPVVTGRDGKSYPASKPRSNSNSSPSRQPQPKLPKPPPSNIRKFIDKHTAEPKAKTTACIVPLPRRPIGNLNATFCSLLGSHEMYFSHRIPMFNRSRISAVGACIVVDSRA